MINGISYGDDPMPTLGRLSKPFDPEVVVWYLPVPEKAAGRWDGSEVKSLATPNRGRIV